MNIQRKSIDLIVTSEHSTEVKHSPTSMSFGFKASMSNSVTSGLKAFCINWISLTFPVCKTVEQMHTKNTFLNVNYVCDTCIFSAQAEMWCLALKWNVLQIFAVFLFWPTFLGEWNSGYASHVILYVTVPFWYLCTFSTKVTSYQLYIIVI